MGWTTVDVAGKAADLFVPDGEKPAHAAIFLHGYDCITLKDNAAYSAEFERHRLRVLCPHGRRCWWSDVVYPPFDERVSPVQFLAEDAYRFLTATGGEDSTVGLGVFGWEMGGQGALQLAYRHARRFPVAIALSPKVDFDEWHGHGTTLDKLFPDREAARQATATLQIHPLNWPRHQLLLCDPADHYCRDGVAVLASKLSSSGIQFEDDFVTSHGGYGWDYVNSMAGRVVGFLAERLDREARRVE